MFYAIYKNISKMADHSWPMNGRLPCMVLTDIDRHRSGCAQMCLNLPELTLLPGWYWIINEENMFIYTLSNVGKGLYNKR